MTSRKMLVCFAVLVCCAMVYAQQPPPQTLTMYYGYSVKPGKEAEFLNLVNTVGAPARDKGMAEGYINAWGVEVPLLRQPGGITHLIWFNTNDYAGVEKAVAALGAQIAKIDAEAAAPAKGQKPMMSVMQRGVDIYDASKTRDYLIRDLVSGFSTAPMTAGDLPYTRYNFNKVKPGQGNAYRAAWEKYNKPVFDKLTADGTLLAYGLAVEDIRTDGDWTHFAWYASKNMAALDKVRDAFLADRARRSQEERDSISAAFAATVDSDAARAVVTRSLIFKAK